MVMDGSNKGLDVLSVASDEAGMNHPSGAAEHDAAQSPRPPPCHISRLCPSIPLSFCLVPWCHYVENMLCALLAANIQHRAIIASIGTDAYSVRYYEACLSILKHSMPTVQSIVRCSLILCPNITCWLIAMHARKKSNQLSQPLLMNRVIWI